MGARSQDLGASLIPLVIVALIFAFLAAQALIFAEASRLPLVAGWDKLLPEWAPAPAPEHAANSIVFLGAVAFAIAIGGVAGAGQQEAYQLLQNASLTFYAFAYLVMFALPLVGRQRTIAKPALWLQIAAASGFLMTALYKVPALVPIIDVPKPLVFTAKIGGFALTCQSAAVSLFYSYRRRSAPEPKTTYSV